MSDGILLERDKTEIDKEMVSILDVEKIALDNVLDKLRVRGKIIESNNEAVAHGSHHSFLIKLNEGFNLIKKRWNDVEKNLIHSKTQKFGKNPDLSC